MTGPRTGESGCDPGGGRLRISIATLGCKVNQFESRALEEELEARGHQIVPFGDLADAVVVNSCAVTHRSDRDTRALARRAQRANPRARVLVTGCYAQMEPDTLLALGVDAVVGTAEKPSIPDLLEGGVTGLAMGDVMRLRGLAPAPIRRPGHRTRGFLKVQDGCDAFCAYCVVPYARGPSRSLPLEDVLDGLARSRETGRREVVVTGVHLGFWGRDLEPSVPFEALLDAAEGSGIPRVRLSSLEPGELTADLVARLGRSGVLCPHLHVPLQSGSDPVLTAMGRPYTAAQFRDRVEAAFDAIPGLCLGVDVIAGFPGENEDAFGETLRLLEGLPLAYLHVFPFSPRRGTRAFAMADRVAPERVRDRARRLRELSSEKRRVFLSSHRGRVFPALAEGRDRKGWLTVRTRNYIAVRIPWVGSVPTDEFPVRLERVEDGLVTGRKIDPPVAGG